MKKIIFAIGLALAAIAFAIACGGPKEIFVLALLAGGIGSYAADLAKEYWDGEFNHGETILHVVSIGGLCATLFGFGLGVLAPAVLAGYTIRSSAWHKKTLAHR